MRKHQNPQSATVEVVCPYGDGASCRVFPIFASRGVKITLDSINSLSKNTPNQPVEGLSRRERQLLDEIERLQQEITILKTSNQDLEIALSTISEHGDTIETELYETTLKLQAEVQERQRAEATLQKLFEILSREKDDLEVIVETIMAHGDVVDAQWAQKLGVANQLAILDELTQIPNRRKFDQDLPAQWQLLSRAQLPLTLVLCDIDSFKQYNDTYGHLAGDRCLRKVAQALQGSLSRASDLVARYGGEEFVAMLPATPLSGAIQVVQKMQEAVAKLQISHRASTIAPHVTISFGIASTIPSPDQEAASLLGAADRKLYEAKQNGRNQIAF